MNQNTQVSYCIDFLKKNNNNSYVPSRIIEETMVSITSETLGRKLRQYSKGENAKITKQYKTNSRGTKIAYYGAKI